MINKKTYFYNKNKWIGMLLAMQQLIWEGDPSYVLFLLYINSDTGSNKIIQSRTIQKQQYSKCTNWWVCVILLEYFIIQNGLHNSGIQKKNISSKPKIKCCDCEIKNFNHGFVICFVFSVSYHFSLPLSQLELLVLH